MSPVEKILLKLFEHHDITKEGLLYLRRFFLFSTRWGGVYLHHIVRSDDDKFPHDHPWDFTTLILSGGYRDEQWQFDDSLGLTPAGIQYCRPFKIYRRKAEHIHRVRLWEVKTVPATNAAIAVRGAWTLVLRGPIRREWNFVTQERKVPWREYLKYDGPNLNEGKAVKANKVAP